MEGKDSSLKWSTGEEKGVEKGMDGGGGGVKKVDLNGRVNSREAQSQHHQLSTIRGFRPLCTSVPTGPPFWTDGGGTLTQVRAVAQCQPRSFAGLQVSHV